MQAHSSRSLGVRRNSAPASASRTLRSQRQHSQTFVARAAQSEQLRPNEELLGAFFFGRAFAVTLNKRITGALFEGLSAVGTAIASRDTLVRSFQEEVVDLARQEMMESSGYVSRLLEGPDSSGSGGRPAISGGKSSEDVQAQIDDLRATIASARSLLQQMRQQPSAPTSRK